MRNFASSRNTNTSSFYCAMSLDTKVRYVGLLGLGSIAVWLTLSLGSGFYLSLTSLRWPRVAVRVTSSGVDTGVSNVGRWWAPEVEYEYHLGGRSFRSSNIRYLMPVFYREDAAKLIQAEYPRDIQTEAAYDPQDPSRSVLEPGVPSGMWIRGLIPVFFWALTGYVFYGISQAQRRVEPLTDAEYQADDKAA